MSKLPPYIVLQKKVGETPLECTEKWRSTRPDLSGVPLAYAGRLDPLASGLLLVLIGKECKHQDAYHDLDKTYEVSVIFGLSSDSGDVLGLVKEIGERKVDPGALNNLINELRGEITLPYPIFSARTVAGKPLHTWAMEGRLAEIKIPAKTSVIYQLDLSGVSALSRAELLKVAREKIDAIPPVTDLRKALGNDFRRSEVRPAWDKIAQSGAASDTFMLANISCTCSSGTYMRSLAPHLAAQLGTSGLALSIHRTTIGSYDDENKIWSKIFT